MMLAGIVLTISFILTSLTLSQVNTLERAAADEESSPILSEWRFLHERLRSNLQTAVDPETSHASFNETILPTVAATFRAVEAEKGYDLVIRAAGGTDYLATGYEGRMRNALNKYDNWTYDGSVHFTHDWDGGDDGVIWRSPCPETGAGTCISGVYLYVRLSDASTSIAESILFAVNQG